MRAATKSELTGAARALLLEGGIEAVTVRSIAAKLGMTAPAIYRYFDSREELLNALVDDLYDELADYLYASLERRRREPLAARFVGASRAYRQWALDHPAEFGLLFGAPIPGVGHSPPAGSDAQGLRGHRFGQLWLELFVELSQTSAVPLVWRRPIPTSLRQQVERYLAALGDPVDVDTALMYLSCWERLYGSVCTEVFGHLSFALSDAEELFEDHLADVAVRLGLDHPDLGPDSARP